MSSLPEEDAVDAPHNKTMDDDDHDNNHTEVDAKRTLDPAGAPTASHAAPTGSHSDTADARAFDLKQYTRHLLPGSDGDTSLSEPSTLTVKDASSYDLDGGVRLAVVFNHERFSNPDTPSRPGTERDVEVIQETFGKKLGFRVVVHDDLTSEKINYEIQQLQSYPDPLSVLAIFILTHGEENSTLHASDKLYRLDKHVIDELTPPNCPALAGKPKLLFVQACQGDAVDPGSVVRVRSRHTSVDGGSGGYKIPNYSDFLVFQASYHGHYSFRSSRGSWFVQSLCAHFAESRPGDEIHTVLTRVKRFVSLYKTSNVPKKAVLHEKKQAPMSSDTLIRELYLKGEQEVENVVVPVGPSRRLGSPVSVQTQNGTTAVEGAAPATPKKKGAGSSSKGATSGSKENCICM